MQDDAHGDNSDGDRAKEPMLAHCVYFTLKDQSASAQRELIDSCHKYLAGASGVHFFAVGTLADLDRQVNDRQFDVALHVIFKNRAAHDAYQTAPYHLQFIVENKGNWAKVRVFDSVA